jgi:hypothetical protein
MSDPNIPPLPWYRLRLKVLLPVLACIPLAVFIYIQTHKPLEVPPQSGPIGQNFSIKQRIIAISHTSKLFHRRGWPASFELRGPEGKILHIYWEQLRRPLAQMLVHNNEFVQELREMGFKRLVMESGKETWDVDLKN